ncbi:MAG: acyltransferase [Lachnospiraceae bacterium]|nr:acyltransferase [Lachnospiraceae bacterium]
MRKAYVDIIKCLAIFIVLMNHIGLIIPFVSSFGGMFYVPVFFVLAGYTYHAREERFGRFAVKKARRLLVPYLTANIVCFCLFLIRDLLAGQFGKESMMSLFGILYSRYSLYSPYLAPANEPLFMTIQNSPTWFLTALFLSYLLFALVLRGAKRFESGKGETLTLLASAALCLFAGVLLHYFCPILLPWSMECIPLFAVYMLAGYFFQRVDICEKVWGKGKIVSCFVLTALALLVWGGYCFVGSANISVGYFGAYVVPGLINGITSSLLVLLLAFRLDHAPGLLSAVGQDTLPILCYHLPVFLILQTIIQALFPGQWQDPVSGMLLRVLIVLVTVCGIVLADRWVLPRLFGKEGLIHGRKRQAS